MHKSNTFFATKPKSITALVIIFMFVFTQVIGVLPVFAEPASRIEGIKINNVPESGDYLDRDDINESNIIHAEVFKGDTFQIRVFLDGIAQSDVPLTFEIFKHGTVDGGTSVDYGTTGYQINSGQDNSGVLTIDPNTWCGLKDENAEGIYDIQVYSGDGSDPDYNFTFYNVLEIIAPEIREVTVQPSQLQLPADTTEFNLSQLLTITGIYSDGTFVSNIPFEDTLGEGIVNGVGVSTAITVYENADGISDEDFTNRITTSSHNLTTDANHKILFELCDSGLEVNGKTMVDFINHSVAISFETNDNNGYLVGENVIGQVEIHFTDVEEVLPSSVVLTHDGNSLDNPQWITKQESPYQLDLEVLDQLGRPYNLSEGDTLSWNLYKLSGDTCFQLQDIEEANQSKNLIPVASDVNNNTNLEVTINHNGQDKTSSYSFRVNPIWDKMGYPYFENGNSSNIVQGGNLTLPQQFTVSYYNSNSAPALVDIDSWIIKQDNSDGKITLNSETNTVSAAADATNGSSLVLTASYTEFGITQTADYTVTAEAASVDTILTGLSITGGNAALSPVFDSQTLNYTLNVDPDSQIDFSPQTNGDVSYSIYKNAAECALTNLAVQDGDTIEIKVYADNSDDTYYTFNVVENLSSNCNLASFSVDGVNGNVSLSSEFSSNTTDYDLNIDQDVTSVDIYPTQDDICASTSVKVYSDATENTIVDDGTSFPRVSVADGNVIVITVTAEDGTTTKQYRFNVVEASPVDCTLSSLTVTGGTLDTEFTSGNTFYTLYIDEGVTSVAIAAQATDVNCQSVVIKVNSQIQDSWSTVPVANNDEVTITVYGSDGGQSSEIYILTVVANTPVQDPPFPGAINKNYFIGGFGSEEVTIFGFTLEDENDTVNLQLKKYTGLDTWVAETSGTISATSTVVSDGQGGFEAEAILTENSMAGGIYKIEGTYGEKSFSIPFVVTPVPSIGTITVEPSVTQQQDQVFLVNGDTTGATGVELYTLSILVGQEAGPEGNPVWNAGNSSFTVSGEVMPEAYVVKLVDEYNDEIDSAIVVFDLNDDNGPGSSLVFMQNGEEDDGIYPDSEAENALIQFDVYEDDGEDFWQNGDSVYVEILPAGDPEGVPLVSGNYSVASEKITITTDTGSLATTNLYMLDVYENEADDMPLASGVFSVVKWHEITEPYDSGSPVVITGFQNNGMDFSVFNAATDADVVSGTIQDLSLTTGPLSAGQYYAEVYSDNGFVMLEFVFEVMDFSGLNLDADLVILNGNNQPTANTSVWNINSEMGSMQIGLYYYYAGDTVNLRLVPDQNMSLTPNDSAGDVSQLQTGEYLVRAEFEDSFDDGTNDTPVVSWDSNNRWWTISFDTSNWSDNSINWSSLEPPLAPMNIEIGYKNPQDQQPILVPAANMMVIMEVDPVSMDSTLNSTSSTDWRAIDDFTNITGLTFDKYSTSTFIEENHVGKLVLGNAENPINLCALDESGNPITVTALKNLFTYLNIADKQMSMNTAVAGMTALNKPAELTMYNLSFNTFPGIKYINNTGEETIVVEPGGNVLDAVKIPSVNWDDINKTLSFGVNSWSEYQAFDTTSPDAPDTSKISVAQNNPGNDDYVSGLEGAVEPESVVKVYKDSSKQNLFGSTTAIENGAFISINIGDNAHSSVFITATDSEGNESSGVTVYNDILTDVPTYQVENINLSTDETNYTITGTAEAGANVTVTLTDKNTNSISGNGIAVGGNYSITLSSVSLSEGSITVDINSVDLYGNSNIATTTIKKDLTEPVIQITSPTEGTDYLTNQAPVTIAGSTEANLPVALSKGETELLTTTADGSGAFSFSEVQLTEGENNFTVTVEDAVGNEGTDSIAITLDTIAPTAPSSEHLIITQNSSNTPDTVSGEKGAVEANCTVNVYSDAQLQNSLGSAQADANGAFDSINIGDNQYNTVYVTAEDEVGNESEATAVTNDITTNLVVDSATDITAENTSCTVTGTAEAGAAVTVTLADTDVNTDDISSNVTAGQDGGFIATIDAAALTDGDITVQVLATDAFGNAAITSIHVQKDTEVPVITISGPVNAETYLTNQAPVTIAGSIEANLSVVLSKGETELLTTTADGSGAFSFSEVQLTEGENNFTVTVEDAVGNEGTDSIAITLDTIAPTAPSSEHLIITQNPSNTPDTVSGENGAVEANCTINVYSDAQLQNSLGSAQADANGAFDSINIGDNQYNTVYVTSEDEAGNESEATAVTNDITTNLVVDSATDITAENTSCTVTGTAEAGAAVTVTLADTDVNTDDISSNVTAGQDGGFIATIDVAALTDGDITIEVLATDNHGNTAEDSIQVLKDSECPQVTITGPSELENFITNELTVEISGSISETNITAKLDKAGFELNTVSVSNEGLFSFTNVELTEGENVFTVTAVDAVGNEGTNTIIINVDTVEPIITLGTLPQYIDTTSYILRGLYEEENLDKIEVNVNHTGFNSVDSAQNGQFQKALNLQEGINTISVQAIDLAGNTDVVDNLAITVDTINPVIDSFNVQLDGNNALVTAVITEENIDENRITANIDGCYIEHSLNQGTITINLSNLVDGQHTVSIEAYDMAENTGSAQTSFSIDTTAPEVIAQITAPVNGLPDGKNGYYKTTPVVSLSCPEGFDIYYNINDNMGQNGTLYETAINVQDGTNITINYWAEDDAGNTGSGQLTIAKVDTSAPDQPVLTDAPNNSTSVEVSLTGTAEAGSTVILSVNDEEQKQVTAAGDGSFSADVTLLVEGENIVSLIAEDAAGNQSSVLTHAISRDTKAPDFNIEINDTTLTITVSETLSDNPVVTVTDEGEGGVTANLNSSLENVYTYSLSRALSGNIRVEVTGTDLAGNDGYGTHTEQVLSNQQDNQINLGNDSTVNIPGNALDNLNNGIFTANTFATNKYPRGIVFRTPIYRFLIGGTGYNFLSPVTLNLNVPTYSSSSNLFSMYYSTQSNSWLFHYLGSLNNGIYPFPTTHFSDFAVGEDNLAPNITFDQSYPVSTSNSSYTISGTVEDNITIYDATLTVNGQEVNLNGIDDETDKDATFNYQPSLNEGENNLALEITDMFGNSRQYDITINLDTTAELNITQPAVDVFKTKANSLTVKGVSEEGATVTVTFDGTQTSLVVPTNQETTFAVLDLSDKADGSYSLNVQAVDAVENSALISKTVVKDTQAGLRNISAPTLVTVNTATLNGETDLGDTVTAKLNGSTSNTSVFQDGTDFSIIVTNLSVGNNTVQIISTDELGNSKSETKIIKYDSSALFTVTQKTPGSDNCTGGKYYTQGNISYSIEVNRPAVMELKNGETVMATETVVSAPEQVTLSSVLESDGEYSITVVGTEAGSGDTLIDEYTVIKDTVNPVVEISDSVPTSTSSSSVTISGTATDNGPLAKFEIYLNGSDTAQKTGSINEDSFSSALTLISGTNNILVKVYDYAGNIGTAEIDITYTARTSSGGGGGGSYVPSVNTTVEESPIEEIATTNDDKALSSELAKTGQAILSLVGKTQPKALLTPQVVNKLALENKPLSVENEGVKVSFATKSLVTEELIGALAQEGANLEIGARVVTAQEKQQVITQAKLGESSGIFEVGGKVVDLTAQIKTSSGNLEKIKGFSEPVAVTIDLSDANLTEEDISNLTGIRYEKDAQGNITPVKLGGTYNPLTKTFTFYTEKFSMYGVAKARELVKIMLGIGKQTSIVNGVSRLNDCPPVIVNNRTMVPIRFISENLGAKVDWYGETRTVKISLGDIKLSMVIGQTGPGIDTPPVIINNRTMVPIRYISESFGARVMWLPSTRSIEIVK